jgi:hypothetical protein
MISFALAQELKKAGFTQRNHSGSRYFVNEHLFINREDAIRMKYADKAKQDWEFKLEEELVYLPTLSELVAGCGLPFVLSADERGQWYAKNVFLEHAEGARGASAEEAVARLWLLLHTNI